MAEGKRYYWLRLHHDFFDSKRIKKLRRMAGGDTYTIIYLKMQLLAMKTDGTLTWTGLEDDFAEELALDLDESAEDIKVTLSYLLHCGLAETSDNVNFFFPYAVANTGSETASTQRSRECRARQKMLQCNTDATQLQQECNAPATQPQRTCSVEKEIEKEIEKDTRVIDREKNIGAKQVRFSPPSVEEVDAYCRERGNGIDAQSFVDHYEANGWMRGKTKIKDWRACVRTWERDSYGKPKKMITASEAVPQQSKPSQSDLDYLNDILRRVKGGG